MAETMSVEAVLSAVDKNFSSTMQSAIREMGEMINKTNQVSNVPNPGAGWTKMGALAGVAGSLASSATTMITNGLHDVVAGLNESSAAWQTFEGNMAYMGKSSGQIKAVKAELQDFAQKSIYSASDMATTYSQLAAVGVKNTTKLVKGFGGLAGAAENPKQAMKTLSMQATQMAAKPMVQWQDFKLMLEQTPAGIAAVAKSMGMSTQQLVKQVQDGKVKTQDFFNAIEKAGNSKAFQKQATTYKTMGQAMDGLIETITNKLQPAFDAIGKVGAGAIGKIIDGISSGSPVVAILGSLAAGIGAFVTTLGTLYAGAKLAQGAMALFNGVLSASPWMLVIAGVVAVVSALTIFFTSTETGKKMWKSFSDFVVNAWNSIKSVVSPTISFLMDLFGQIGTAVQGMIQTMAPVMQTMGAVFAPLMTALQQLWSLIQPFVTFILQVVGAVLLAIVVAAITGIIGSISLLTSIITALIGVFTAVVSTVSSVWQSIMAIISGAVAIIVTVVTTFGQAIIALFTGHWNRIPGIFSSGWAKVKSIFSSTISTLNQLFQIGGVRWFQPVKLSWTVSLVV
nr:tape measure protein [Limosilactobacillus equigenerosi]